MTVVQVFAVQVVLSTAAWCMIAWRFVIPALKGRRREDALAILITPQMFRHIGMTMLVPGVVATALPAEFSNSVAYGDLATAVLALLSFAALKAKWSWALWLVWLMNGVGTVDLVHNLVLGARLQVAGFLHAAWFVPAFGVPMMAISHLLIFHRLIYK